MGKNTTTAILLLAASLIVAASLLISGCSMAYNGAKLFVKEGCSQCHTFNGKGGRMGPDLSGVSNLRSDSWTDSYLQDPKKMNPVSRMPSFGHLSKAKRKAIIAFLRN